MINDVLTLYAMKAFAYIPKKIAKSPSDGEVLTRRMRGYFVTLILTQQNAPKMYIARNPS